MPANPVYITRNSVDISSSIDWPSVQLLSVLTKEVSTLTFSISINAAAGVLSTIPAVGDAISMYDSSGIIFGGTVTDVQATAEALKLTWYITCTDYSYQFDGVLVKKNYAMMDPHDIVLDIVANFAAGKGFTTNHVQVANFLVPSIKFNYQQPTKCLESLAKLIGWEWYIDAQKDIHFFLGDVANGAGEGGLAPITIDETTAQIEWNSLNISRNIQNMKNSVFVIGGNYSKTFNATNTPDVYKTVAGEVVYTIGYPYDRTTIQVTLDGVAQTVGIDQQTNPATVQVLYNDSNRFVKFTSDPGAGHTLKVFGQAMVPIIGHASDADAITTYGEYQDVIVDKKITSVAEAQSRAKAEVLQFGSPVYLVKVNTLVPGCRIGQVVILNLPKFGITNYQLIIRRIEAVVFVPGSEGKLEYRIEAVGSASDTVTMVDLMTLLLQQQATQNPVDDSTVNENLEIVVEVIAVEDGLVVTATTGPYVLGPGTPTIRLGFSKLA